VVEEDTLDDAPYIVSLGTERLVGGVGSRVYARGIPDDDPTPLFTVLRQGDAYVDPENPDEVLGYEAQHIADASLERTGDSTSLLKEAWHHNGASQDKIRAQYES